MSSMMDVYSTAIKEQPETNNISDSEFTVTTQCDAPCGVLLHSVIETEFENILVVYMTIKI